MKYIFYTILTLSFLASCGGESTATESSNDMEQTTTDSQEENAQEDSHFMVGSWRADAGVEILMEIKENGTFAQSMAGQKQEGTWTAIDENQIKIESENVKNGQTWKITEKGDDEMKVVFSVKDGFSKQAILFKKQ
jgi:hypothetical protein